MQEIVDMDHNIELLQKAIRDKEGYMKVAQTRLDERAKKLSVEICRDPPMNGYLWLYISDIATFSAKDFIFFFFPPPDIFF